MNASERAKEEKKIKNKRTGRTRMIWGWILLIVGGLNVIDGFRLFNISFVEGLQGIAFPLILALVGVYLIQSTKKNVAKWDKYDALINQNGNTPLPMLADKMGLPLEQVRKDIQFMLPVVQIRRQHIVVVIRRLQTVSCDHLLRGFQRLIGSLAEGHAALRDSLSFGTVDPAEGLDILQHFRAVCLDPGFDLLPVLHLLCRSPLVFSHAHGFFTPCTRLAALVPPELT